MGNNETFNYTYSAKQQDEIKEIRKKYLPQTPPTDYEAKLAQLRKLDASADQAGMVAALIVGIVGMTMFAYGMVCVTAWADRFFALGVVIGMLGLAGMAAAWPLRGLVANHKREQIAPEVLKLTEELSQEN